MFAVKGKIYVPTLEFSSENAFWMRLIQRNTY